MHINAIPWMESFRYKIMNKSENVFLVGPMGVGKTTIGRALADLLGKEFYDSDREIESSAGADIPWIFDVEGEDGFRLRELKMIDQLTQKKGIVLATGGGAVIEVENRKWLSSRGVVVYLQASLSQQIERTSRDKSRPLLQTSDPAATVRELAEIRDPFYREVADILIETNRRHPRIISQEIEQHLDPIRSDLGKAIWENDTDAND
jgi:shikimate kinase